MELLAVTVSGMVVSILTSLFKTSKLTSSQRSSLALGLSILGGVVSVLMSTDMSGALDITKMAVASFAASQVVYTGILKNTQINTKIEAIDVFSPSNKKKVEELAKLVEDVAVAKATSSVKAKTAKPVAKPPKAPAKKATSKKAETK